MAGRASHVELFQRAAVIRVVGEGAKGAHLRQGALSAGSHSAVETQICARQAGPRFHILGEDIVVAHIGGEIAQLFQQYVAAIGRTNRLPIFSAGQVYRHKGVHNKCVLALWRPCGVHGSPGCCPQKRIAGRLVCRDLQILFIDICHVAKYSLKGRFIHIRMAFEFGRLIQSIVHAGNGDIAKLEAAYHILKTRRQIRVFKSLQVGLERVKRTHHSMAGKNLFATFQADTPAFTTLGDKFAHRGTRHHCATVSFNIALHTLGKHAATALGY